MPSTWFVTRRLYNQEGNKPGKPSEFNIFVLTWDLRCVKVGVQTFASWEYPNKSEPEISSEAKPSVLKWVLVRGMRLRATALRLESSFEYSMFLYQWFLQFYLARSISLQYTVQ